MKNILVTGGAGFIGSNFILETLGCRPNCRVVNLDLLTYAGNLENLKGVESNPKYHFIRGDIRNPDIVAGLLHNHEIDVIVHLAAETHVDRSIEAPDVFLKTNVLGTFNLLQCALNYWQGTHGGFAGKRFLHVSTDEVYGSLGSQGYFTETTPYRPNSPYSASKAASDHLARSYFKTFGLPVIITNCSNNYGPFQFPEKLIPLMINNILNNKSLPIYGQGKNIRDWLYVQDHCTALLSALEKGIPGEQYNIGGRNEWHNIDIVKTICRIMDKKLNKSGKKASENLITFVTDRPGHDLRYAIDASKTERDLGWTPRETFESGIKKTVEWYLNNQTWMKNATSGDYLRYYDRMYGER
jgi:dTDP-glucose 4,6-dehydratase